MEKTGAQLLVDLLQSQGVDLVFGYPGGAILPFYDKLHQSGIKHILVRHEQGAIHMAEAYARVTGKTGVVVVTSGPGVTNIITGLADAKLDSIPVFVICGQVPTMAIGSDAFQEADTTGISTPVTKYSKLIRNADEIAQDFIDAWTMCKSGRPGPVLLDFPKDVQNATTKILSTESSMPDRLKTSNIVVGDLNALAEAYNQSQRPLLIVGGGAINSGAASEVAALAQKTMSAVSTTLMGLGAFPGENEQCVGMPGMHGTAAANKAILECDFLLSLGMRFDDRIAGQANSFASQAIRAHIDIDGSELNKRVQVDHIIQGDLKQVISDLIPLIEERDRKEWMEHIQNSKKQFPLEYEDSQEVIKPQRVLEQVYKKTSGQAIVATDVGQHQMWAAQYYLMEKPGRWLTSGGLGTMGYGLPAAIGAKIAKPDDMVICVTGDGSFQMCLQELATIRQYNANVKILLLNNDFLGMVRQWQELFFDERYAESEWQYNPDFVKIADAYGIKGKRITKPVELDDALDEFLADENGYLLEVVIPADEKVFPMIPAGGGQEALIQFRDLDRVLAERDAKRP